MNTAARTILAIALAAAFSASRADTTLTFIQHDDLHAHLTPHKDVVADPAHPGQKLLTERGGLARTATLIKQIRASNPNSVLMNIGDTYHGGVEGLYTNGNAVSDAVNALGVDVGVPGNWDYAYGPAVTRLRYADLGPFERAALLRMVPNGEVKRPNFPNLAANVTYTMPAYKAGQNFLPPTLLKSVGNVRVGFIGLSSDIVPEMSQTLAMGLNFVQGESNYAALVTYHAQALRQQGAAVVVVMSELGIQKNYQLAGDLAPGLVDVLFSAHTHEVTQTPLTARSGTLVVESGNDGWLGRMDVTVASNGKRSFAWRLIPIDKAIPEDPAVKALVSAARAPFLVPNPNMSVPMPMIHQTLTRSIATVVGHTDREMDRRGALENVFNDAFTDALRRGAGTRLAMAPGFRFDAVTGYQGVNYEDAAMINGDITIEDVYRLFPVPYTLSTATVSGSRLYQILEAGLTSVFSHDAFAQHGGWMDGYSGIKTTVDLSQPDGSRVKSVTFSDNGMPVAPGDLMSVAGCSRPDDPPGVLCSYDGFQNVQPLVNPTTGMPWYVADYFLDILSRGPLAPRAQPGFTDLSGAPVWPTAPYVQPVYP